MAKMENKTGDHEVSFPSLIKDEDLQADNSNELSVLVEEIKQSTTTQSSKAVLKSRLKTKLLQLINDVEHCSDYQALCELDKGLSAKQFLFQSMLKQPAPERIPLKENRPAKKNLDRQRQFFFSTRRKRKR